MKKQTRQELKEEAADAVMMKRKGAKMPIESKKSMMPACIKGKK